MVAARSEVVADQLLSVSSDARKSRIAATPSLVMSGFPGPPCRPSSLPTARYHLPSASCTARLGSRKFPTVALASPFGIGTTVVGADQCDSDAVSLPSSSERAMAPAAPPCGHMR